jgi:hypothetical protein
MSSLSRLSSDRFYEAATGARRAPHFLPDTTERTRLMPRTRYLRSYQRPFSISFGRQGQQLAIFVYAQKPLQFDTEAARGDLPT